MDIRIFKSIEHIPLPEWESVCDPDFPFSSYHFLRALETTDCLGRRTGWDSFYITAWDREKLLTALVAFAKDNSYGEYIFDFAWAEAHLHSGLKYYPKLVAAIPFSPVTGPKLLWRRELQSEARQTLAHEVLLALEILGDQVAASSTHLLFCPEWETEIFRHEGYFIRESFQFHWTNSGYKDFADFLSRLRGKRRREILRERAQVNSAGIHIETFSGDEIETRHAEIFYRFYFNTVARKGGFDYLTFEFFEYVFTHMKSSLHLVLANSKDGSPVAGALNYVGRGTLYGRHWGCLDDYKSLHFELCYYQGIEWAIARDLKRFEAGAQGEHKFNRGFLPTRTFSAHKIRSEVLRQPIQNFVLNERRQIEHIFREFDEHTPFTI